MRWSNSNCIFFDIRSMKKMICFLTGFLFFACSNNPAVTVAEVEDDWVYGEYVTGVYGNHTVFDGVLYAQKRYNDRINWNIGDYISEAVLYKINERKYLQVIGRKIPPIEFNNGRAEYQDSLVKLVVEKNGDKFYVEFTAPKYYNTEVRNSDYYVSEYKKDPNYLKVFTTKTFLIYKWQ